MSAPPDDDPPPLPADRTIRMWGEICSSGMWDSEGYSIYPEDLPIPAPLVARLDAWAAWYDAESVRHDGPGPWEAHGGPIAAFDAEGQALADALRAALGPKWTIVYKGVAAWRDPAPRI